MKTLLFASLLTFAFSAQADLFKCTQQEAQFIGTVSEVRIDPLDQNMVDCFYKINFSHFNSSMVCPLDISDVYDAELQDMSCQLKKGDHVSGVLVKKDGSLTID